MLSAWCCGVPTIRGSDPYGKIKFSTYAGWPGHDACRELLSVDLAVWSVKGARKLGPGGVLTPECDEFLFAG